MIIDNSSDSMDVSGILMDIFCTEIVGSLEEAQWAVDDFRGKMDADYQAKVLADLRKVIESPDYSYAEKAAFFACDHCQDGEAHAEELFRRGWALLSDNPYPERPAPLQMETMILDNEVECSSLRALLVGCFNREVNRVRRTKGPNGTILFSSLDGDMGFRIRRSNTNRLYAKLLRQVLVDGHHTFVEKAKFFIRDYYQDGEEAAREIFKRIFADRFPTEPNPLA